MHLSNHTKYVLRINQKCMTHPTLINLRPKEYSQIFHYYPFAVKLYGYVGSFNGLFNKACVPNKIQDLNLSVFNMITGINNSKISTKHISCQCKCRFDKRKYNSCKWWNNDSC